MTSIESIILRLVATLDLVISAVVPWLMGIAAVIISICAALLVRRIVLRLGIM